MSIRIETLDDGYLVVDTRGPRTWRGAAVTMADAETLARHRAHPWTAPPPPGPCLAGSGYAEAQPVTPPENCGVVDAHAGQERAQGGQHLAAVQFDQATGGAECVGGVCSLD